MTLLKSRYLQIILYKCCGNGNFLEGKKLSLSSKFDLNQERGFVCRTGNNGRNVGEIPNNYNKVPNLKHLIKNPKHLVAELLDPMVKAGDTVEPFIVFTPKIHGTTLWKASLQLCWPQPLTFTGIHYSLHQAEENAYLQACGLFNSLGLMHKHNGTIEIVDENNLLMVLQKLYENGTCHGLDTESQHNFSLSTTKVYKEGFPVWQTNLEVPWPFPFSVSTSGLSFHSTQYTTCLLAFMRLKVLGLLDKNNNLNLYKLPKASKRNRQSYEGQNTTTKDEFDPEYQIYVDASKTGFGAYLLTKDKDGSIHWISESWHKHFPDFSGKDKFDTAFYEYYALVSACYTWKHKFVNKRVLCWSDNMSAVTFTNHGPDTSDKPQLQKYGKLYLIMIQMCSKYNIKLKSLHVRRVANHAADLLSKLHVNEFKKHVPEASSKSKKTKKLLFWNPLVDDDNDQKPKPKS